MKRVLLLLALGSFIACSDGDLQIETIDFDSVDPQNCGTLTTSTTLFFKLNDDQALILKLASGLLKNEASASTITSNIGTSGSQLTYRIFSDNVTSAYFCSDFPPATPTVTEEIEASDGQVLITTVAVDETTFEHTIQLQGITLENDNKERITDLTINEFGVITTTSN